MGWKVHNDWCETVKPTWGKYMSGSQTDDSFWEEELAGMNLVFFNQVETSMGSISFTKRCLKKTNSWRLKSCKAIPELQHLRVDLLHQSRKPSTWSSGGIHGVIGIAKATHFLQYGQKPAIHITVSQWFCEICFVSSTSRPWPQKFATGQS